MTSYSSIQLNEGTTFATAVLGLNTPPELEDAAFDKYILDLFIDPTPVTQDVLDRIHELYPANSTTLGGAFNTGDSLFDRAEAWYSDNMYLGPRRLFFDKAASTNKLFTYFFTEFIPGNNITNGGMYSLIIEPRRRFHILFQSLTLRSLLYSLGRSRIQLKMPSRTNSRIFGQVYCRRIVSRVRFIPKWPESG